MNYGAAAATIAALTMSVFAALPASAFACGGGCGSSTYTNNSVTITVNNSGSIDSDTTAKADTGDNTAQGSYGGDAGKGGKGGSGGDAEAGKNGKDCGCDPSVGNATGGNGGNGGAGGNGGDAGPGGLVDTGNATANAGSLNTLNSTEIDVQAADCGCNSDPHHSSGWGRRGHTETINAVTVAVTNGGSIDSDTKAKVETGDNTADGSYGGDGAKGGKGGSGGDAETHGGALNWDGNPVGGDAYGGSGGNGGVGGDGGRGDVGGTIRTGAGESNSGSINLMNSTIVRVTR